MDGIRRGGDSNSNSAKTMLPARGRGVDGRVDTRQGSEGGRVGRGALPRAQQIRISADLTSQGSLKIPGKTRKILTRQCLVTDGSSRSVDASFALPPASSHGHFLLSPLTS